MYMNWRRPPGRRGAARWGSGEAAATSPARRAATAPRRRVRWGAIRRCARHGVHVDGPRRRPHLGHGGGSGGQGRRRTRPVPSSSPRHERLLFRTGTVSRELTGTAPPGYGTSVQQATTTSRSVLGACASCCFSARRSSRPSVDRIHCWSARWLRGRRAPLRCAKAGAPPAHRGRREHAAPPRAGGRAPVRRLARDEEARAPVRKRAGARAPPARRDWRRCPRLLRERGGGARRAVRSLRPPGSFYDGAPPVAGDRCARARGHGAHGA